MLSHNMRSRLRMPVLALIIAVAPFAAEAAGELKRIVLKRVDLTGVDGIEVITALIEAEPGAHLARHSHHGDEFLYVLEGGMIQVPGKDPVAMTQGQTLHFPRGMVHGGFDVVGEQVIKALTVHVVDKGKPLVVPAE